MEYIMIIKIYKMFICPRCNYKTKFRGSLKIHFNRKKRCLNFNDVELEADVKHNALYDIKDATINQDETVHSNPQLNANTYENLYEHFCKHMPTKSSNLTLSDKRKVICGKAIHEFDKLKWDKCLENIPKEIDVDTILMMMRCLINFPNEYKTNHADFVYNTRDKPSWLNDSEFYILSHLVPMIEAFERNTLKMMFATCDESNYKIHKRLHRLYKLILCLDIETTISHLDEKAFVKEILDVDDDQLDYLHTLESVKDSKVIHICKIILETAKEELKSEEDDTLIDSVNKMYCEIQCISETMSDAINNTFNVCSYPPEFLNKMMEVNARLKQYTCDIPKIFK